MSFIFPSVCLRPTCPIFWNFGSYKSDKKVANLHLQCVNLVVVPHLGSIDSRITHALAFWASSMSRRSRGLHSRRGHCTTRQDVSSRPNCPVFWRPDLKNYYSLSECDGSTRTAWEFLEARRFSSVRNKAAFMGISSSSLRLAHNRRADVRS